MNPIARPAGVILAWGESPVCLIIIYGVSIYGVYMKYSIDWCSGGERYTPKLRHHIPEYVSCCGPWEEPWINDDQIEYPLLFQVSTGTTTSIERERFQLFGAKLLSVDTAYPWILFHCAFLTLYTLDWSGDHVRSVCHRWPPLVGAWRAR